MQQLLHFASQFSNVAYSLGESDFMTPEPEEWIKTEAGRIDVVSRDFKFLQEADLAIGIMTLETDSISLPAYHDAPVLSYILQGKARAGLISPLGFSTQLRDVEVGDIVAVPKGWTFWLWNSGSEESLKVMCVGQTARGTETGFFNTFRLMGVQGQKGGGSIQGFSDELLSRAWNVDPEEVKKLLESQSDAAFIKVGKGVSLPESSGNHHAGLGEYTYNLLRASPDVLVKDGGSLTILNMFKFPILKQLDLSACRVHLKRDATLAPHFVNAARILHVLKGSAQLEITFNDGKEALRTTVQAGDLIVVPAMMPLGMFTTDDEVELIAIGSKAVEVPSFLAGFNSLYHALPKKLLVHGFNVDEEIMDKFWNTRRHRNEVAIFPSKTKHSLMENLSESMRNKMEKLLGDIQEQLMKGQEVFSY